MPILTDDMFNFLQEWAAEGAPVARKHNLPVSAMLACASIESGWGKGAIFRDTLNPFSLQKWPHVIYPRTHKISWRTTIIEAATGKTAKAPFVCATDRATAVLQWCEWILHYGKIDGPPGNQNAKASVVVNKATEERRLKLLSKRNDPVGFAKHLYLVGFGENAASGEQYAKRLVDYSLRSYDQ